MHLTIIKSLSHHFLKDTYTSQHTSTTNFTQLKYFNWIQKLDILMWQSPQPLTEATVLVGPFLLQIDTFGKRRRCLTNVCDVKLKRRFLDRCRLSAPAETSALSPLPGILSLSLVSSLYPTPHMASLKCDDWIIWNCRFHLLSIYWAKCN